MPNIMMLMPSWLVIIKDSRSSSFIYYIVNLIFTDIFFKILLAIIFVFYICLPFGFVVPQSRSRKKDAQPCCDEVWGFNFGGQNQSFRESSHNYRYNQYKRQFKQISKIKRSFQIKYNCQIYYFFQSLMFRVHLQLFRITLRVKENVQLQVVIKKGEQNFFIPQTTQLQKCVAQFNTQTDFFIAENDPSFMICVMIVSGQNKKFVGMFLVNLGNYQQNTNICIEKHLQKCPDSQASISFNFRYTTTSYDNKNKSLVRVGELQLNCMRDIQSEMEQKNESLMDENQMLSQKLQNMKKQNNHLTNNKDVMNNYEDYRMREESSGQKQDQSISSQKMIIIKDKMNRIREYSRTHETQETEKQVFEVFKSQ